jgi:hypothetical protein
VVLAENESESSCLELAANGIESARFDVHKIEPELIRVTDRRALPDDENAREPDADADRPNKADPARKFIADGGHTGETCSRGDSPTRFVAVRRSDGVKVRETSTEDESERPRDAIKF